MNTDKPFNLYPKDQTLLLNVIFDHDRLTTSAVVNYYRQTTTVKDARQSAHNRINRLIRQGIIKRTRIGNYKLTENAKNKIHQGVNP